MKKVSLLLTGVAFIATLTFGITKFSHTDQLATHGHFPAPATSNLLYSEGHDHIGVTAETNGGNTLQNS